MATLKIEKKTQMMAKRRTRIVGISTVVTAGLLFAKIHPSQGKVMMDHSERKSEPKRGHKLTRRSLSFESLERRKQTESLTSPPESPRDPDFLPFGSRKAKLGFVDAANQVVQRQRRLLHQKSEVKLDLTQDLEDLGRERNESEEEDTQKQMNDQVREKKQELEEMGKKLEELEEQLRQKEFFESEKLENLKKETEEKNDELEGLKKAIKENNADLTESGIQLRIFKEHAHKKLAEMKDPIRDAGIALEDLNNAIGEKNEELNSVKTTIEEKNEELNSVEKAIQKSEKKLVTSEIAAESVGDDLISMEVARVTRHEKIGYLCEIRQLQLLDARRYLGAAKDIIKIIREKKNVESGKKNIESEEGSSTQIDSESVCATELDAETAAGSGVNEGTSVQHGGPSEEISIESSLALWKEESLNEESNDRESVLSESSVPESVPGDEFCEVDLERFNLGIQKITHLQSIEFWLNMADSVIDDDIPFIHSFWLRRERFRVKAMYYLVLVEKMIQVNQILRWRKSSSLLRGGKSNWGMSSLKGGKDKETNSVMTAGEETQSGVIEKEETPAVIETPVVIEGETQQNAEDSQQVPNNNTCSSWWCPSKSLMKCLSPCCKPEQEKKKEQQQMAEEKEKQQKAEESQQNAEKETQQTSPSKSTCLGGRCSNSLTKCLTGSSCWGSSCCANEEDEEEKKPPMKWSNLLTLEKGLKNAWENADDYSQVLDQELEAWLYEVEEKVEKERERQEIFTRNAIRRWKKVSSFFRRQFKRTQRNLRKKALLLSSNDKKTAQQPLKRSVNSKWNLVSPHVFGKGLQNCLPKSANSANSAQYTRLPDERNENAAAPEAEGGQVELAEEEEGKTTEGGEVELLEERRSTEGGQSSRRHSKQALLL